MTTKCLLNNKFPEIMTHGIKKKIIEVIRKAVLLFHAIQTRIQDGILGNT